MVCGRPLSGPTDPGCALSAVLDCEAFGPPNCTASEREGRRHCDWSTSCTPTRVGSWLRLLDSAVHVVDLKSTVGAMPMEDGGCPQLTVTRGTTTQPHHVDTHAHNIPVAMMADEPHATANHKKFPSTTNHAVMI